MSYIGRFAPSPSGPLHFGSLVAAIGSWLDAKANNGQWLVRVEDLDPPREMSGAIPIILNSLEAHGLNWDSDIMYQSQRLKQYDEILTELSSQHLYACSCTRKDIRATNGLHRRCDSGNTLDLSTKDVAWRLKVDNNPNQFDDLFHGPQSYSAARANEDYILKRKDGLHAYMLAVVADDIEQNISHIVRGADLLDTSCQQIYLFKLLTGQAPRFGHLPMAMKNAQQKLSKQTHAPALIDSDALNNIKQALLFLKQDIPTDVADYQVDELLSWASQHWQPERFSGQYETIVQRTVKTDD